MLARKSQCAVKSRESPVGEINKAHPGTNAPPGTTWRVDGGNKIDQARQEKGCESSSGSVQAVTRVNVEQASKRAMWTPSPLRLGEGWHLEGKTLVPSLPVRYSVLCYYGPLRLPLSPLHPLAGLALGPCLPMSSGLPCSYEFPLCSCPRHYSGGLPWGLLRSLCPFPWTRVLPSRCQPSPNLNGLGVHIALFEACSTFTRVTA